MLHRSQTGEQVHTPFRWIVADQTEREALSVLSDEVGKLAWQTDDNTVHVLAAVSPSTVWANVGGGSLGTAAGYDVGTDEGDVPLLIADGKIPDSVFPDALPAVDGSALTGVGGAMEFVSSADAAGQSTVDFNGFDSGYDYIAVGNGVYPATATTINARLEQSSAWVTTGVYYNSSVKSADNADTVFGSERAHTATSFLLCATCGAYTFGNILQVDLPNVNQAVSQGMLFSIAYPRASDGNIVSGNGGGYIYSENATTGIRFFCGSGNFGGGVFTLYRRKRS